MDKIIKNQIEQLLLEFYEQSKPDKGALLVIGCSTSEVLGKRIGSDGSEKVAGVIMETLLAFCTKHELNLAVQCCEHLNRSLVIEKEYVLSHQLTQVNAVPVLHAGGALAACAYNSMKNAVLAESIQADLGIDIGLTLIGMHLKPVAVPVRTSVQKIGEAVVVCARSRPKYVGGSRAVYDDRLS